MPARAALDLGDTNKLVSFNLADLGLKRFPTARQNCQLLARGLTSIMWRAVRIDENAPIEFCREAASPVLTKPQELRRSNRLSSSNVVARSSRTAHPAINDISITWKVRV
jgi:hypothetical protein